MMTPSLKADRLEQLDISYARKAEEESARSQQSIEDRLLALQRDLEARYKQRLEAEISQFRSRELAKVRQKEKEQYQQEIEKEKAELHCRHQLRLDEVKRSEQQLMEKYHRKEQVRI